MLGKFEKKKTSNKNFDTVWKVSDEWVDILPNHFFSKVYVTVDEQLIPFRGDYYFRQYKWRSPLVKIKLKIVDSLKKKKSLLASLQKAKNMLTIWFVLRHFWQNCKLEFCTLL